MKANRFATVLASCLFSQVVATSAFAKCLTSEVDLQRELVGILEPQVYQYTLRGTDEAIKEALSAIENLQRRQALVDYSAAGTVKIQLNNELVELLIAKKIPGLTALKGAAIDSWNYQNRLQIDDAKVANGKLILSNCDQIHLVLVISESVVSYLTNEKLAEALSERFPVQFPVTMTADERVALFDGQGTTNPLTRTERRSFAPLLLEIQKSAAISVRQAIEKQLVRAAVNPIKLHVGSSLTPVLIIPAEESMQLFRSVFAEPGPIKSIHIDGFSPKQ